MTAIKRPRPQFSVIFAGLVLLLIGSFLFSFSLIRSTNIFYHLGVDRHSNVFLTEMSTKKTPIQTNTIAATIEALFQEKKLLEEKVNICKNEMEGITNSLKTEKEIRFKTNETFFEKVKLYEQEKERTANATVFDRNLFNYMSTFLRDTPYPGVDNYTRYTVARLGMSPLAGIEPLIPEYGPVFNDFTSFRYPISIEPCQIVTKTVTSQNVVVVVNSAPDNFEKRNSIRQTWRNHLKTEYHKDLINIVGFAFILAMPDKNTTQAKIEEESKTHKDIIQIDIPDIYRRMAVKVAGLFNWLNRNCAQVGFVLKADDDVYINVRNLAHFVAEQQPHQSNQSIFGTYIAYGGTYFPVNRVGKWNITFEEWPWHRYPHYLYGPCVAISGNSIFPLLAAMQTTPIMPFDDVYYIGICTEKTDIRIQFSSKSTSILVVEFPDISRPCNLRLHVSWLTDSTDRMNKYHVAVEDIYHNKTQCIIAGPNDTNTIINNEPVHFDFDTYFHSIS